MMIQRRNMGARAAACKMGGKQALGERALLAQWALLWCPCALVCDGPKKRLQKGVPHKPLTGTKAIFKTVSWF